MQVLVTGVAGFIGMHVARALLASGQRVLGIDNLNDYYDPALKHARLARLRDLPGFSFARVDLADLGALQAVWQRQLNRDSPVQVVHLAAQAGVRYSVTHPHTYAQSNLVGFLNLLECCRTQRVGHLVYASSSSVYGGNLKLPFSEDDAVDHPVSLYAATKKANELMAHSYAHLYRIPCTGLRFFTVYGPWGRPDMAAWLFTQSILEGRPIRIFNHGDMSRDFTYIDDIVRGVLGVLQRAPAEEPGGVPARVLNIGSHAPVRLLDFVAEIESALGLRAELDLQPMQPGDVPATFADISRLESLLGQRLAATPLRRGVRAFVDWYRAYHRQRQSARQAPLLALG